MNQVLKVFSKKRIKLSWEEFDEACIAALDFINNLNFSHKNTCLLGMARGALPFMTKMSHIMCVRDISVVQAELTRSDTPHDRGNKARVVLAAVRKDKSNFIVLEDIIHTAKSVNTAIKILQSDNKHIKAIISLVATADFCSSSLLTPDVPIFIAYKIPEDAWIEFPWEH